MVRRSTVRSSKEVNYYAVPSIQEPGLVSGMGFPSIREARNRAERGVGWLFIGG